MILKIVKAKAAKIAAEKRGYLSCKKHTKNNKNQLFHFYNVLLEGRNFNFGNNLHFNDFLVFSFTL